MGSSFAFLALSIAASGYLICSRCYWVRYDVARESGHRIYLSALMYGFLCLLAALFCIGILWFLSLPFGGISLPGDLYTYILGILVFVIAAVVTEGYNRKVKNAKQVNLWRAWQKDDLELVCATALTDLKPVAISLDSQKVYVGMVADTMEPKAERSYLSILPLYSGYRDSTTQKFTLIHRYKTLINILLDENGEGRKLDSAMDYVIVIPRERIVTIHIFNSDLYSEVSGRSTPPTS